MALVDTTWYVNDGDNSTTGWWAVGTWNNNGGAGRAWTAGQIVRQSGTPTVGNERCYICIVAGTGGTGADPLTTFTRGVKITDGTATWQECTGASAVNGDVTNTPVWTAGTAYTLGQIIKRVNAASYWICSTAGTAGGSEPAWANNNAGTTRTDNTATWTCLGVVGNFTGWQAPHARLANAFASTWGQAGNSFFVASEHAETQSTSMTLTAPGTAASPVFIYCVTKTAVPPTSANLTTGASITTTGNSFILATISGSGHAYCRGIAFNCGTGANNQNLQFTSWHLENCALANKQSGTGQIRVGTGGLINTTVEFNGASQLFVPNGGDVYWRNTPLAVVAGTLPTTLISSGGSSGGSLRLLGVDLSALGSGKTLVGALSTVYQGIYLIDCKLGASVTVAATPSQYESGRVYLIRSDSGATNYRSEIYGYAGTLTTETTIVRTGGATDGTTAESWKIATTANSIWVLPFESQPITIWNDSTSAITTLTIYGTTTGGGVPKDDELWVEVEYLGSSLTPQGSFITSTKADNLAASAATNNSADASTWGGSGAGNGFKIVVPTFAPGQKGPINIVIKAAKASTTYYVDPRPSITNVSVSKSAVLAPGVYANELVSSPAQLVNSQGLVG
jgi:hypothetical protein